MEQGRQAQSDVRAIDVDVVQQALGLSLLPVDRIEPTDLDAPRLSNRLRELLRERIDWERRFEIDLDFDDEFE